MSVESRAVGRRRASNLKLPAGVREIADRWYWQPTSLREREERKAKGLPATVPLGKAGSIEARTKWAELTGLRDPAFKDGTVGELLSAFEEEALKKRPTGIARAASTVQQYRYCLPALKAKFGPAKYGRTEYEASRGQALGTAEVQRFITASGSLGRKFLAVLKGSFDYAIRCGKTTYNPCEKAIPQALDARTRAPAAWEVECLQAMATPVLALLLGFKSISGYRISEILRVHRRDLTAEGIRLQVKGGKWETLLWSPGLRSIVAEAEALPTASKFPGSPLFPHSRGKAYTYAGFYAAWSELLEVVNGELAAGIVDVEDMSLHPGLRIEDLHVHDIRSKVHDDAEEMGREGHEAIGNTERVADKHYARRERRRRPLR